MTLDHASREKWNCVAGRLSPGSTLLDALSCLLTQGLDAVAVGDDGPGLRYLGAHTVLRALQADLPAETPVSELALAESAAAAGSEAPGAAALINGLPLRMWLKGRDGRYLIVNRSFA